MPMTARPPISGFDRPPLLGVEDTNGDSFAIGVAGAGIWGMTPSPGAEVPVGTPLVCEVIVLVMVSIFEKTSVVVKVSVKVNVVMLVA